MGDCGGEESPPVRVGGKGRSMSDGRLRTSFSFLDDLCGGVDFFGLQLIKETEEEQILDSKMTTLTPIWKSLLCHRHAGVRAN